MVVVETCVSIRVPLRDISLEAIIHVRLLGIDLERQRYWKNSKVPLVWAVGPPEALAMKMLPVCPAAECKPISLQIMVLLLSYSLVRQKTAMLISQYGIVAKKSPLEQS